MNTALRGIALGLLVGVAAFGQPAWANRLSGLQGDGSDRFETTVLTATTASVGNLGKGTIIYGFSVIADDAGDYALLCDSATVAGCTNTQGVFIDEIIEDTDNRTQNSEWPAPYVLQTDLTVRTNAAAVVIYHSKVD